ncbi:MAG TPA: 16S rRNA (cytosine(1402)-N(4))-methyltransferase RsmH [Fulvivirga sp.]|nr:16S rRNA (cytosine(1402)-N(4))-methyltransferase RsmH [Fulvivirga sp.]
MTDTYHIPVMLKECIEGLNIKPNGIYVDLTFGGGGHSREILKKMTNGHLYAFDQDKDAVINAEKFDSESFTLIEGNFRYLKRYLKAYGITKVDGILGDLGISSHQIDEGSRGFSTRFDAELDMRMDQSADLTAKNVVNGYSQDELQRILGMYGEVRNAKTLAMAIVAERINKEIVTVEDLKAILNRFAKRGRENRYYAQVFQAIRIEVNQELKALEEVLEQSAEILNKGGRLVIMSYHSLEDRPVKNFIATGKIIGGVEKDFYGNVLKPLVAVNRKPIEASEEERAINNRARSAKLRVAEKI